LFLGGKRRELRQPPHVFLVPPANSRIVGHPETGPQTALEEISGMQICTATPSALRLEQDFCAVIMGHILRISYGESSTPAVDTVYNLRRKCGECISMNFRTGPGFT
jgi:hypothetical protein